MTSFNFSVLNARGRGCGIFIEVIDVGSESKLEDKPVNDEP
jgi:hypothetical protein